LRPFRSRHGFAYQPKAAICLGTEGAGLAGLSVIMGGLAGPGATQFACCSQLTRSVAT
jgi:hypothetical protein